MKKIRNRNVYQWQGELVKTRFGSCLVSEEKDRPLYWYNYEVSENYPKDLALIPCIQVESKGSIFLIANHFGIGVHKLSNGGWPSHTHFSLEGRFEEAKFPTGIAYMIRKFDLQSFEEHEKNRRIWQKQNFPEEFAKKEALMQSMRNSSLFKK